MNIVLTKPEFELKFHFLATWQLINIGPKKEDNKTHKNKIISIITTVIIKRILQEC